MNYMNTHPKFQTQYDKIIQAYFKDEIKPQDAEFCICGTLCNNNSKWAGHWPIRNDYGHYTGLEYTRIENALFFGIGEVDGNRHTNKPSESGLFSGMCAALDVLKQIHIERGEVIDEVPVFKQRQLASLNKQ